MTVAGSGLKGEDAGMKLRSYFQLGCVAVLTLVVAACHPGGTQLGELNLTDMDAVGVFGGEQVQVADPVLKFVVSIQGTNRAGQRVDCTGTLVHRRVVLTAAHCLEDSPEMLKSLKVRFGSITADSTQASSEVRGALQTVRPEDWDHYLQNEPQSMLRMQFDVGLILLESDAPKSSDVISLNLVTPSVEEMPRFWALGYGAAGGFIHKVRGKRIVVPSGMGTLRKVEIKRIVEPQSPIHYESAQDSQGICYGDSGGPAFVQVDAQWVQVGVASYITSDGQKACRKKGYFLSLGQNTEGEVSLTDWIQHQVQILTRQLVAADQ